MVDRGEALQLLGLNPSANPNEIEKGFQARKADLEGRIAHAPIDTLRDKYRAQLAELELARASLLAVPGVPGLSRTQVQDLPAARPEFTDPGGESPAARINVAEGQVLAGRYEMRRRIGAGGMGAVFAAWDRNREQEIAIKVMLPGLLDKEGAVGRFMGEAKLSLELSHTNIVKVLDVQRDGALHFITMELLEGRTLREELQQKKKLDVSEAVRVGTSLCAALSYAHKRTVHRDVKPENVFLCADGAVKLMDFGIARVMSASQLTVTGMSMGTAYYMAPEQLKGAKEVDGRADQYSAAVVLYEMLTGEVPAGRVKPAKEKRRDVPQGLSDALDRALEADPGDRFPDMDAFATALSRRGPVMSRKTLGWTLAIAGLVGLGATFPVWGRPTGRYVKGLFRSEDLKSKAMKARDEAAREADTWDRWIKTSGLTEPPEIAQARKDFERGDRLLTDADDEEAARAFADARDRYREVLDRARVLASGVSEAGKSRDEALAAARQWEQLIRGLVGIDELPEIRQGHQAFTRAEKLLASLQPREAVAEFQQAREFYAQGVLKQTVELKKKVVSARSWTKARRDKLDEARNFLEDEVSRAREGEKTVQAILKTNGEKQISTRERIGNLQHSVTQLDANISDLRRQYEEAPTHKRADLQKKIDDEKRERDKESGALEKARQDLATYEGEGKTLDPQLRAARILKGRLERFQSRCKKLLDHELAVLQEAEDLARDAASSDKKYDEALRLYDDIVAAYDRLIAKHDTIAWLAYEPEREKAEAAELEWSRVELQDWEPKIPQRTKAREHLSLAIQSLEAAGKYAEARREVESACVLFTALTADWTAFLAERKAALSEEAAVSRKLGDPARNRFEEVGAALDKAKALEEGAKFPEARDAWTSCGDLLKRIHKELDKAGTAGSDGRTDLHRAAEAGDLETVRRLLKLGLDAGRKDRAGTTALHLAVVSGSLETCRALIAAGAKVDVADSTGRAPLHLAVTEEIATFLLESSASVDAATNAGRTPLHLAVEAKREAVAKFLLGKGAKADAEDREKIRPLHLAGTLTLAQLLLEHGAAVDPVDASGRSPLFHAAAADAADLVAFLLQKGADPKRLGTDRRTLLHDVAAAGAEKTAAALLDGGAAPDAADASGRTPLHEALSAGRESLALLLIRRGAPVGAKDRRGRVPLHGAAERNLRDAAAALLEKSADPGASDDDGNTPLLLACGHGHVELAKLLVSKKAPLESSDRQKHTPLLAAIVAAKPELAEHLLSQGANAKTACSHDRTALHYAAGAGYDSLVRALAKKADVNAKGPGRRTPLHVAAAAGHESVLVELLAAKADVRAKDDAGRTPLFLAIDADDRDCARLLVDAGSDVDAADDRGLAPADRASAKGWDFVAKKSGKIRHRAKLFDETTTRLNHPDDVYAVGFLSDTLAVTASKDRKLRYWDLPNRKVKQEEELAGIPNGLACSSDGRTVAVAAEGVYLWEPAKDRLNRISGDAARWVCFSTNGAILAWDRGDKVELWDVASGRKKSSLSAPKPLECGAFSPNGRHLATGDTNGSILVWEVASGKLLKTISGHTGWIRAVCFGPDGNQLLSSSNKSELFLWDVDKGKTIWQGKGGNADVGTIAFSPDGSVIAYASRWGVIEIWDARTSEKLWTRSVLKADDKPAGVRSIAFSPGGRVLATAHADSDGKVRVWGAD